MRTSAAALVASLLSSSLLNPANIAAQQAVAPATPRVLRAAKEGAAQSLPVRSVALYKNGVGFFEHAGEVSGNQQVTIDFTSEQLNDVLQTLTAIDLNGGKINGAGYNSTTPLDQQLKSLPLALSENPTETDLYQAIRGARIEVTGNGAAVTGRLLNVESRDLPASNTGSGDDKPRAMAQFLTVVSDGGGVRTIQLNSQTQVRLLDGALHQDLSHYLELLAANRGGGLRHLTLDATGTGGRQIRVSYISEVPVWKSTYRLIFSDGGQKQQATLQSWAVIDNTVGTDWNNVQLSLIAGSPQSFIQPISQPYYARRPEIGLPHEAQLTPQTHDAAINGRELKQEILGGFGAAPMPSAVAGIGSGAGSGLGPGSGGNYGGGVRKIGAGDALAAPTPIAYEDSAAASIAPNAAATAYDDYFEYKLNQPITIRKNESAMVPVLQSKVDVERVTLWSSTQPRPLRALWLTNSTGATLDRGSFSIIENGSFGGEGLLDPIHPNERRLLSYAADDAVRVSTESALDSRHLQQVTVHQGVMKTSNREIAEITYVVHNSGISPRMVIVEHVRRHGWELDSDTQPAETTPNAYRYRVAAAPGETIRLHVGERHTISQSWRLATFNEPQLDGIIRTNGDDPRLRQQLQPILEARHQLAQIDTQIQEKQTQIDGISKDQDRLRNNLSALKNSAEERDLIRRYTRELNEQEDQIAASRKDQDALKQKRTQAQADLDAKVQSLETDQSF